MAGHEEEYAEAYVSPAMRRFFMGVGAVGVTGFMGWALFAGETITNQEDGLLVRIDPGTNIACSETAEAATVGIYQIRERWRDGRLTYVVPTDELTLVDSDACTSPFVGIPENAVTVLPAPPPAR